MGFAMRFKEEIEECKAGDRSERKRMDRWDDEEDTCAGTDVEDTLAAIPFPNFHTTPARGRLSSYVFNVSLAQMRSRSSVELGLKPTTSVLQAKTLPLDHRGL
ncbi:hypothetical protein AVEN_88320-1 [Araneus ventricosus]|uniref:Uncharacterized protein n=1 Tax=Araneus ventricosus TaxID=182803 RepID=A0A4Y2J5K2_ARAVE|nr:hypothetical protein AVEN_220484-1 [Araneus ventricosus]GBO20102.1 hypothetical protein AVEN_88320-1 [Araneus ventricosus]